MLLLKKSIYWLKGNTLDCLGILKEEPQNIDCLGIPIVEPLNTDCLGIPIVEPLNIDCAGIPLDLENILLIWESCITNLFKLSGVLILGCFIFGTTLTILVFNSGHGQSSSSRGE
jgi:hypothetical protein